MNIYQGDRDRPGKREREQDDDYERKQQDG